MANCRSCGKSNAAGTSFCTECGQQLSNANSKQFASASNASRAQIIKRVGKAAAKSVAKSVALSFVILGPGFAMLMMGFTIPGMIWLFCGSFGLMAWTYRKPWQLGIISCLIPPLAAGVCYAIQLALFGNFAPPIFLIWGGVALGVGIGYWRAKTHEVKEVAGGIVAERTIGYLVVWVVAYGVTQILGLSARSTFAVSAGLVTGAFSTAMFTMVSLVIWKQYKKAQLTTGVILCCLIVGLPLFSQSSAEAQVQQQSADCGQLRPMFNKGILSGVLGSANLNTTRATQVSSFEGGRSCEITYSLAGENLSASFHTSLVVKATPQEAQSAVQNAPRRSWISSIGDQGGPVWQENRATETVYIMTSSKGAVVLQTTIRIGADADYYDLLRSKGQQPVLDKAMIGAARTIAQYYGAAAPDTNKVAAAAAAVAAVLIAAGVAVNIAQAIATAIANALQAGVQMSAEEVQSAIADALLNRSGTARSTRAKSSGRPARESDDSNLNRPPNVTSSERIRPPRSESVSSDANAAAASERAKPESNAPPNVRSKERVRPARGKPEAGGASDNTETATSDRAKPESNAPPNVRSKERVRPPRGENDTTGADTNAEDISGQSAKDTAQGAEQSTGQATAQTRSNVPGSDQNMPEKPQPSFWGRIAERLGQGADDIASEIRQAASDVSNDKWEVAKDAFQGMADDASQLTPSKVGANIGEGVFEAGKSAANALADGWDAMGDAFRDPRIIGETMAGTGEGLREIGQTIEDGTRATAQAGMDLWNDPELRNDMLDGMDRTVENIGKTVSDTVSDPDKVFDGVKIVSGAENLGNALDHERTVYERMGQLGLGLMGVYGTITGAQSVGQGLRSGASGIYNAAAGGGSSLVDDGIRVGARSADEIAATVAASGDELGSAASRTASVGDEAGAAAKTGATSEPLGASTTGAGSSDDAVGLSAMDDAPSGNRGVGDEGLQRAPQGDDLAGISSGGDDAVGVSNLDDRPPQNPGIDDEIPVRPSQLDDAVPAGRQTTAAAEEAAETAEEVRSRARSTIGKLDDAIDDLDNQLRTLNPTDPAHKEALQRRTTLDSAREARRGEILDVNNTRLRRVDAELAELQQQTSRLNLDDDTVALAQRQRELQLERQTLMRESHTMRSDHVAGQVNVTARPGDRMPGGLRPERAKFDIGSDGSSRLLPNGKDDIGRVIDLHVNTKGGNSPYQSWTASRDIAVDKFGADQLAVAHIPLDDFEKMRTSQQALSPRVVSSHSTRANSEVEMEWLIHKVKDQNWRIETPEMRRVFSQAKLPIQRNVQVYTDPQGNRFAILYRSMHPKQFPSGVKLI